MPPEAATTIDPTDAEEAQAQADFDSGAEAAPAPKAGKQASPVLEEKPVAEPKKPAAPEFVHLTREQFTTLNAAAAKTASYDSQFARAFGTLGNLQKALTTLQTAAPRTGKFEIPKDAFAGMERDFPELAEHTRAALEATLRGVTGNGGAEIDPELMKRLVTEHATEARANAEMAELEEEHPEWRGIVGQVDISKQQPDANNPFRKWLATKPAAYQARLNSTNSAAVISRAITLFQAEVKPPVGKTPSLQAQLQAARIKGAIQPRGDGGQPAATNTDEDDFAAGFAAG